MKLLYSLLLTYFFILNFFYSENNDEEEKMVKLLVKMSEEWGKLRTNVTTFNIPVIIYIDGDIEYVLESLLALRFKVIKSRQLEDKNK